MVDCLENVFKIYEKVINFRMCKFLIVKQLQIEDDVHFSYTFHLEGI